MISGYYQSRPEIMVKLCARIDNDSKKSEKLIAFLDKQDEFALDGTEYKRRKETPGEKAAV